MNHSGNYGGGIGVFGNCTLLIAQNVIALNSSSQGGALYSIDDNSIHINNSILWDNRADQNDEIFIDSTTFISVEYSDIAGGIYPGEGNISTDPLFRDTANDDFHLMAVRRPL